MEYTEMVVEGRLCYIPEDELKVVYMMSSRTTGCPKKFEDIPADAFIVKLLFVRKWQTSGSKAKQMISKTVKPLKQIGG